MAEEKVEALPAELWAVIGENGSVWATFNTQSKAEGYPGPRMLEMAPRYVVRFVRYGHAPNTRQRAERAAQAVINEFQGCMLVPDGYTHKTFYLRRLADIIAAEFEK